MVLHSLPTVSLLSLSAKCNSGVLYLSLVAVKHFFAVKTFPAYRDMFNPVLKSPCYSFLSNVTAEIVFYSPSIIFLLSLSVKWCIRDGFSSLSIIPCFQCQIFTACILYTSPLYKRFFLSFSLSFSVRCYRRDMFSSPSLLAFHFCQMLLQRWCSILNLLSPCCTFLSNVSAEMCSLLYQAILAVKHLQHTETCSVPC